LGAKQYFNEARELFVIKIEENIDIAEMAVLDYQEKIFQFKE